MTSDTEGEEDSRAALDVGALFSEVDVNKDGNLDANELKVLSIVAMHMSLCM